MLPVSIRVARGHCSLPRIMRRSKEFQPRMATLSATTLRTQNTQIMSKALLEGRSVAMRR